MQTALGSTWDSSWRQPNRKMNPFSPNTESLNTSTISMYYTWSNSGFTHTFPRRAKKANPREAHNQGRTKNCTTIVVLPSPRSLFSSIERQLDCRFPSAAGQRNQSRLKQTAATPIQDESIRQDGANVNSLSTCTRPGTELTEGFLQIPSK